MIVTRFAPSPTGILHLGHAFAALYAFEAARADGGRFVLRIEDIDTARCRAEYERAIEEDLVWLGLSWDRPVRRQSEHFADYAAALDRLKRRGFLYPCFCTRKEIAEEIMRAGQAPHVPVSGPEGPLYPGTCQNLCSKERSRRMESGASYALRLDTQKARAAVPHELFFEERGRGPKGETGSQTARPEQFGDIVIARKEMPASYHLAVTFDDAHQGVTLVTRGEDLFHATHIQVLLQALLNLPTPAYSHHRLILNAQGKKFSKRDTSANLRALRESGTSVRDIRAMVGLTNR